jgi:hypothetical protein
MLFETSHLGRMIFWRAHIFFFLLQLCYKRKTPKMNNADNSGIIVYDCVETLFDGDGVCFTFLVRMYFEVDLSHQGDVE